MKIEGRYEFRADRRSIWKALQDPELLAATLPGAKSLEVVGPDRYKVVADVGVGSVKGTYDGTFSVTDKKDFESCVLRGSARGGAGSIEIEALSRLSDSDGGGTVLAYEADARVAGPIAGVGQRMIGAASKRMSSDFFGAIDGALTDAPVPAEVTATAGDRVAEVGRIYTKPPGPEAGSKSFLAGVAVGFALAIIGVIIGRRTA
ncbi:MAG: SRPBCC family protein [Actinomycetota bacterium]